MEVCRSTPQPSSQPLGAASPYRDPAFEFNAPRFFDFQRFDHDISPPSSEGDTYFDTSQVKELRTPERSSGDENNEDTAQLLKDIQKVREELRQEEEATSIIRQSIASAKSPLALPAQQGGAQTGHGLSLAELVVPPVMETVQQEKIVVSGTVRAVGPMRIRPAEAKREMAGRSNGAQACTDGHQSLGKAGVKASSANMAEGPVAATAAAQQPGHEQGRAPLQDSSAGCAQVLSAIGFSEEQQQPQHEAAAAKSEIAAAPMDLAGVPAAVCGAAAAPGVLVLAPFSQALPGPEPLPTHPGSVSAAQTALKGTAAAKHPKAERAAVSKRPAPANLVTSWAPRGVPQALAHGGPPQHPSSGLVAPGTSSLVHSAGKSHKVSMAQKEEAPGQKGDGRGGSGKAPKELAKGVTVGQPGSKRLDRPPEANAMHSQSGKRHAELAGRHTADAGTKASRKRARVSAAAQKDPARAADAVRPGAQASGSSRAVVTKQLDASLARGQPAEGSASSDKPTQRIKAAQKSQSVPKSPKLGKHIARTHQDKEPAKAVAPQQRLRNPSKAGAGKRRLTEARTPHLRTSKRVRTTAAAVAPPAQDQEEWKPLALMVAEFEASTPARFNHGPRAVQYVPPPQPGPDARVEAPDLATDARLRPSRFKPREEQELEDIANRQAFQALPVNAAVMSSRGDLGVRLVPARPVTRSRTPILATRARAAAHPAPSQGVEAAPAQRAPFDPNKLTVPQSPAFATRSRLRAQGVKPVEPAGSFMFRAQSAIDQGAGQVASGPQKSRRRQTSSFKPFQLSTDSRARTQHSTSFAAEHAKAPAFHAAPVPRTLYRPAQLPALPEAKPTQQQAFHLLSEARHQQAVAEQEAKLKAERVRERRKSKFKAAPPPHFAPPPPPNRSERPATCALTPKLAVETRSTARAAFDAMVAGNKLREEEQRAAEAAERAAEDARELKEYRSQLTFKARPMPQPSAGPQRHYVLPEPKMTIPVSPQLQTRSRARLPG